jgi:hypothetical protein
MRAATAAVALLAAAIAAPASAQQWANFPGATLVGYSPDNCFSTVTTYDVYMDGAWHNASSWRQWHGAGRASRGCSPSKLSVNIGARLAHCIDVTNVFTPLRSNVPRLPAVGACVPVNGTAFFVQLTSCGESSVTGFTCSDPACTPGPGCNAWSGAPQPGVCVPDVVTGGNGLSYIQCKAEACCGTTSIIGAWQAGWLGGRGADTVGAGGGSGGPAHEVQPARRSPPGRLSFLVLRPSRLSAGAFAGILAFGILVLAVYWFCIQERRARAKGPSADGYIPFAAVQAQA